MLRKVKPVPIRCQTCGGAAVVMLPPGTGHATEWWCPHCGRRAKRAVRPNWTTPGLDALHDKLKRTTQENAELNQLFDLQHSRVLEAEAAWRKAHPGNDLVSPDLGRLVEWLMKEAGL